MEFSTSLYDKNRINRYFMPKLVEDSFSRTVFLGPFQGSSYNCISFEFLHWCFWFSHGATKAKCSGQHLSWKLLFAHVQKKKIRSKTTFSKKLNFQHKQPINIYGLQKRQKILSSYAIVLSNVEKTNILKEYKRRGNLTI